MPINQTLRSMKNLTTIMLITFWCASTLLLLKLRVFDVPVCTTIVSKAARNSNLAYQQSYGYFDNIDDEDWQRRRKRAQSHEHHKVARVAPSEDMLKKANYWYLQNYYPLFTCPGLTRVGGPGDGPKWTCDPHQLRRIAQEGERKCLIYSVGSNGNYQWEDGLVKEIGPVCEIHVFDIKKDYTRKGDAAMKNIHFHHWGLRSSYNDMNLKKGSQYEFFTLAETMKKLNHENQVINIFKIDCEGCEWTTYKDWISKDVDVRQILVETHGISTGQFGIKPNDFFDDIQNVGFAMYSKEGNLHPDSKGNSVEWSFIKLQKEFFSNYGKSLVALSTSDKQAVEFD